MQVPAGWGRTTVLDRFEAGIDAREDAPVTLTIRIDGQDLPGEASLQAQALRDLLAPATERHRAAELLGLDRAGGVCSWAWVRPACSFRADRGIVVPGGRAGGGRGREGVG